MLDWMQKETSFISAVGVSEDRIGEQRTSHAWKVIKGYLMMRRNSSGFSQEEEILSLRNSVTRKYFFGRCGLQSSGDSGWKSKERTNEDASSFPRWALPLLFVMWLLLN